MLVTMFLVAAEAEVVHLLGVVGHPAGRPDHRPDVEGERLGRHLEVDRVVGAGRLDALPVLGLDDRGVDHVARREGHGEGQVGRLHLLHAEVVLARDLRLAGLGAFAAAGAVLVDEARSHLHLDGVAARLALDLVHFGHGQDLDARIVLDAPEVDLQPAGRGAELGEVLVQLGHPASQVGVLLDQKHLVADFGRFEGRGEPADAAADHQDAPAHRGCVLIRHGYLRAGPVHRAAA